MHTTVCIKRKQRRVRRSARACGEAYAGELQIRSAVTSARTRLNPAESPARASRTTDRGFRPAKREKFLLRPASLSCSPRFSVRLHARSPPGRRRRRASLGSLFLPRLAMRSRCSCRFSRLRGDGSPCDDGSPSSAANFQQLPAKRERSDATAAGAPWLTESTEATKNTDFETLLICRKALCGSCEMYLGLLICLSRLSSISG